MSIDPQAARLLRMLGAVPRAETGRIGVAERRRSFDGLMRLSGAAPSEIVIEDRWIEGPGGRLRLRLYTPANAFEPRLPGLLYFHGGGLVAGSIESYDVLCRTLALHAACRLIAVDYRLAPEHPFPAAIEDALCVTRHVLDAPEIFGLANGRIAIGGDSAGGTLTAIVTQALRSCAGPPLRAQMLLCPVLDFAEERPSKREFAEGYLLDTALMVRDLEDLAPNLPLDDPRLSPLRAADLSGLPPALIHTAAFDPLRDEGAAYAAKLTEAGIDVSYACHTGMVHHFYGLAGMIPAARGILAEIGAALSGMLRAVPDDIG